MGVVLQQRQFRPSVGTAIRDQQNWACQPRQHLLFEQCHPGSLHVWFVSNWSYWSWLEQGYSGGSRSLHVLWWLTSWFLASPGHQQPWYRLCRINVYHNVSHKDYYIPRTTKLLGGILVSLRPSVRPPVRPSVPTVLVRSISYLYILSSNFRMCVACKVSCKISKLEFLAIF